MEGSSLPRLALEEVQLLGSRYVTLGETAIDGVKPLEAIDVIGRVVLDVGDAS